MRSHGFLAGVPNWIPARSDDSGESTTTLGGESMKQLKSVYRMMANPSGQTMAEYAMILATIALISIALEQNAGTILKALTVNVVSLFGV